MATPPTITQGAQNGATAIASGAFVSMTDARFRYFGVPAGFGAVFPDNSLFKCPDSISYVGAQTIFASGPWFVEWVSNGSQCEFYTKGQSGQFRLRVDGQLATARYIDGPPSNGSGYRVLIDFAGVRASRTYRLEMTSNHRFGGVAIGPADTLSASTTPMSPKIAWLGDSYTEGGSYNAAFESHVHQVGDLIGWTNVLNRGLGATGYLNDGGSPKVKFADRVTKDIVNLGPDVVFISGGHNDTSFTAASVAAQATAIVAAIQAALPATRIWLLSPWSSHGAGSQFYIDLTAALGAVASARGVHFIDTITDPWFTGSGNAGSPSGSGNADLYIGADNTHPTLAGHTYAAGRLAALLRQFRQPVARTAASRSLVSRVPVVGRTGVTA